VSHFEESLKKYVEETRLKVDTEENGVWCLNGTLEAIKEVSTKHVITSKK
jgi:hypothetical protein